MLKAVLIDFDGTLVTQDILDVVCRLVGKEGESRKINQNFHAGQLPGLSALIQRVNFLKGVTVSQINQKIAQNTYLVPGAQKLMIYLKQNSIASIIHSGNIIPVLSYYQKLLGADYIVGTKPKMYGDKILGISEDAFSGRDFKVVGVKKILKNLSILPKETLAIGDSPADKTMFEFAKYSIAINPKGGIEELADYVIADSLENAIPIIRALNVKLTGLKPRASHLSCA